MVNSHHYEKKSLSDLAIRTIQSANYLSKCVQLLFEETTTIGLRYYRTERTMAAREMLNVTTPLGTGYVLKLIHIMEKYVVLLQNMKIVNELATQT